jgi:hypothetical protein
VSDVPESIVVCFRCAQPIEPDGDNPVSIVIRARVTEGDQTLWAHVECLHERVPLGVPMLPALAMSTRAGPVDEADPAEAFYRRAVAAVTGQQVVDRLLAGNSVSVFVDDEAGARWTIWLDPSWRLEDVDGVLAGSRQAQDEEEESGWSAVGEALDRLVGSTVEFVWRDAKSGDLVVQFSGSLRLRTFTNDPRDVDCWRITEKATRKGVEGGPGRLSPFTLSDRGAARE